MPSGSKYYASENDYFISNKKAMKLFWILWGIDAVVALVLLYFFLIGLIDNTISSENLGLWLLILVFVGGVLFGSNILRINGYVIFAKIILAVIAIPALLYLLFIFNLFINSGSNWQ